MELFDASGMDGTSSAASGLADALASLAKPLQEISANTAKTAQSATQDMRPNQALDDFFANINRPVPGATTEAQRNAAKAAADAMAALKKQKPGDFLAKPLSASLPVAQNVGNLPTASRMANVLSATRAGGVGAAGGGVGSAMAGLSSFTSALGPAGIAVGAIGAAAIGVPLALKGLVSSIVSVSAKMTEAFDPFIVDRFNLALRDARAVFGSILYPVVQQATRVVKAFADTVFNTGSELTASVKTLAKSFGDLAVASLPFVNSGLKMFAAVMTSVSDSFRQFADFLGPQITSFTAIFDSLAMSWRAGFGSLFGTIGSTQASLTQLGQAFARANVIITAWAYRLTGMNGALGALQKSLADGVAGTKKDATGLAAAQNARTMGVAELGKSVLQQAFIATGRPDEPADMTTEEFQKQLLAEVEYISGGGWKEDLKTVLMAVIKEIWEGPATAVDKLGEETARQVGGDYGAGAYQATRSFASAFTFGIL